MARRGRRILALDGCVLKCASACLASAGVVADTHLPRSDCGVRKRQRADFNLTEASQVYAAEVRPAARTLRETMTAGPSTEPVDAVAQL